MQHSQNPLVLQPVEHLPRHMNLSCGSFAGRLGDQTWPIVRDFVDDVVTVSEGEIIQAMQLVFERLKVCLRFPCVCCLCA